MAENLKEYVSMPFWEAHTSWLARRAASNPSSDDDQNPSQSLPVWLACSVTITGSRVLLGV